MPFTPEQVLEASDTLDEWLDREDDLLSELMLYDYGNQAAQEFMHHGLGRRLRLIKHCIERIFETIPMDDRSPDDDALMDATAFLQSFLINIFGAIDNMGHIWCLEAAVTDNEGREIPRGRIGLRPQNRDVRGSLSEEFSNYLAQSDTWFGYLEDYRHALAHRIPLYIPPRTLDPEAQLEHAMIQREMDEALRVDRERYFNLLAGQHRLGVFEPLMMHSYGEAARPIYFHPQIICDFATTIEIGEHLLRELQTLNP